MVIKKGEGRGGRAGVGSLSKKEEPVAPEPSVSVLPLVRKKVKSQKPKEGKKEKKKKSEEEDPVRAR